MTDTAHHCDERIRSIRPRDRSTVNRLGTSLFQPYGHYGSALDVWLRQPGVKGYVSEIEGIRTTGFVLVATRLAQLPAGHSYILGIGVEADRQGLGLGRRLLATAIDDLEQEALSLQLSRLQLNVAEDNERALRLFRSLGFCQVRGATVAYGGGQRGITMERP
ncbi:MAG TPA: hypothetical protein DIU15_19650, partial [Deltaproteobacteria bacterium]|nr:hypothetical protein [Deltaproteobacteria bacterium]